MSEKRWAVVNSRSLGLTVGGKRYTNKGSWEIKKVTVPGPGEMIVPVQDLLTLVKASGYRPNTDEHDITSGEYVEAYSRLRALLPEEPVLKPCPAEGLTNGQHHQRPRTVGDSFHAIVCICGVSGPESATEKNALAWWNALPRRADTPAKGES